MFTPKPKHGVVQRQHDLLGFIGQVTPWEEAGSRWGRSQDPHLIRLDLGDQILEGGQAAQPHHGLGLLPGQALDLGCRARAQHDLLPPQEVLEFRVVGGLPGERAAVSRVLSARVPSAVTETTASSGGTRAGAADSPDGALELDPGQQHGEGDVVLVQHASGHAVERHL